MPASPSPGPSPRLCGGVTEDASARGQRVCMYIHICMYILISVLLLVRVCHLLLLFLLLLRGGCFFVVAVGEYLLFAVAAGRGGVFPFAVWAPAGRSLTCWFAGASAAEQFVPEGGAFVLLLLRGRGCLFFLLLLPRVLPLFSCCCGWGFVFFFAVAGVFLAVDLHTHIHTYILTYINSSVLSCTIVSGHNSVPGVLCFQLFGNSVLVLHINLKFLDAHEAEAGLDLKVLTFSGME